MENNYDVMWTEKYRPKSLDEMVNIMNVYGSVITYKYIYKKYQAVKTTGGNTIEYIHYLKCGNDKTVKQIQVIKVDGVIIEES